MTTAAQLRAARSMLGYSQTKVAAEAGVSVSTLKRAEGSIHPPASTDAVNTIQLALETAGVEFIEENGGGAGVRLKKRGNA